MNPRRLLLLPLVSLLALGACKSVVLPQTVDKTVGDTQAVGATAELRFILARPKTDGDVLHANPAQNPPHNAGQDIASSGFNVCAEPNPDVAKAISQAITENANATLQGLKAIGGTGTLSANQAFSLQQNSAIAELGRKLATTQLLRDGLYRLCEAFANGVISKYEYALVMSRYGDTMVTLLAIEAVAGISANQTAAWIQSRVTPPTKEDGNSTGQKDGTPGKTDQQKTDDKNPAAASPSAGIESTRADDATRNAWNALSDGMMKVMARTDGTSTRKLAKPAKPSSDSGANTEEPGRAVVSIGKDAAQAVVSLQQAYLNQSRYAPLLALCTAALGDSALLNTPPNPQRPKTIAEFCSDNMSNMLEAIVEARGATGQSSITAPPSTSTPARFPIH